MMPKGSFSFFMFSVKCYRYDVNEKFQEISEFECVNQSTNKMAANDGQNKLTQYIDNFFLNTYNEIKIFDLGEG